MRAAEQLFLKPLLMNAALPFPAPSGPSLALPADLDASAAKARQGHAPSRNVAIALAVVLLHIAFIWALQSGLLMRAAELIVPAEVLSQFVDPPSPQVKPTPPAPPVPPAPVKKAVSKAPALPAPQPLAIADNTPSPNAPTGVVTPQAAPTPIAAAVAIAPAAPAAAPAVQLPSSDANISVS